MLIYFYVVPWVPYPSRWLWLAQPSPKSYILLTCLWSPCPPIALTFKGTLLCFPVFSPFLQCVIAFCACLQSPTVHCKGSYSPLKPLFSNLLETLRCNSSPDFRDIVRSSYNANLIGRLPSKICLPSVIKGGTCRS